MTLLRNIDDHLLAKAANEIYKVGFLKKYSAQGRGRANYLGAGWVDFKWENDDCSPVGILDDAIVCTRPYDNVNVAPPPGQNWYNGLGGAYRHTFVGDKEVTCLLPGGHHDTLREMGPAIVVPGTATTTRALGLWPSHLLGGGLFFLCYQGNPVTDFAQPGQPDFAIGSYDLNDPLLEEDFTLSIRMTGDEVRAYDWLHREVALQMVPTNGDPLYPIDFFPALPEYEASPYAGLIFDNHLEQSPTTPDDSGMYGPLIKDWWCQSID